MLTPIISAAMQYEPAPQPTKQVIVIRRDLRMRRGKEIAQGAHASMAWLRQRIMPHLTTAGTVKQHHSRGLAALRRTLGSSRAREADDE